MFDAEQFLRSALLMLVLLNPFLLSVYLLDLVKDLGASAFRRVLVRGAVISSVVFCGLAVTGELIFSDLLQVRFASFLIFGGVIFLIVGIRIVMAGPDALREIRGKPEHVAGSVAMPFMIGPATVNASILTGSRLPALQACGAILAAMTITILGVLVLKAVHDRIHATHERLVTRYVDVVGRLTALYVGTVAVEMVLQGIEMWLQGGPMDPA